ncbi:MAG: hypothetical protein PUB64_05910 [Firmicutes bacterium]|nr:hypothetical protein [Bacillota bacterium]
MNGLLELFLILIAIAVSIAMLIVFAVHMISVPAELRKIRLILQNGRDIPEDPKEKGPYDD